MVVTDNGSSDLQRRSLLLPSAPKRRRRPPPPLSVNLFGKLGDDLLEEILIRLPNPRSWCRCKPVCRRWRSLLSDPSFNRRFGSHHQSKYQPEALFLHSRDPQSILSFLPVPDEAARPDLRVLDCFKDLLLCGFAPQMGYTADGIETRVDNSELERSYFVCNPFTKQWIALPLAPEKPPSYLLLQAGLFCKPRSTSYNLVGDDEAEAEAEAAFVYSEYRFRVACICQCALTLVLQVFCPESGEWTQRSFEGSMMNALLNAVSWYGEFILYHIPSTSLRLRSGVFAFDPFLPDMPLKPLGVPRQLLVECSCFSVSQGAFHLILFVPKGYGLRTALSVWRLDGEDGPYWNLEYETVLNPTWGGYQLKDFSVVDLHPEKPEIVYFKYLDDCVFSCNFATTGEPEFFCSLKPSIFEAPWRAFQPRVTCWPTPIPRYEELRGLYDGSYNCWVQNSSSATLPSAIEECQALVEQTRRGRKNKRPAASHSNKPCGRMKQKVLKGCLCPVCNKKPIIFCDPLKGKEPQALLDACAEF